MSEMVTKNIKPELNMAAEKFSAYCENEQRIGREVMLDSNISDSVKNNYLNMKNVKTVSGTAALGIAGFTACRVSQEISRAVVAYCKTQATRDALKVIGKLTKRLII